MTKVAVVVKMADLGNMAKLIKFGITGRFSTKFNKSLKLSELFYSISLCENCYLVTSSGKQAGNDNARMLVCSCIVL